MITFTDKRRKYTAEVDKTELECLIRFHNLENAVCAFFINNVYIGCGVMEMTPNYIWVSVVDNGISKEIGGIPLSKVEEIVFCD